VSPQNLHFRSSLLFFFSSFCTAEGMGQAGRHWVRTHSHSLGGTAGLHPGGLDAVVLVCPVGGHLAPHLGLGSA
jgi:hypothetical protein